MLSSSLFWIIPGSIAGNMKLRWNKGRGLQTKGLKGWAAKGNLWKISQIFIKIGDFTSALSISIRAGNLLIPSSLISSFCSNQMSNCEQFAQITQDKWATMSESLRLLRGNERPWANRSGHSRQMSNHERFARVAQRKWANERCEWIAHFAQIKWAMWANRSFCSPKMSDHERFSQVAQRKLANERFAQNILARKI